MKQNNLLRLFLLHLNGLSLRLWVASSKIIFSDKLYLFVYYFLCTHEILSFKHPRSFNQKIQWLKLHNTSDICTQMADKYAVRQIISDSVGPQYLIPLLDVWNSFNEINFDDLPNEFVLKTTHDSGSVVICTNKAMFDYKHAKRILIRSLHRNYFWDGREYPYKKIHPRIIAEKFMSEPDGKVGLNDYKFMCFGGKVKCSFVCSNRNTEDGLNVTFFDRDWNMLPFSRSHPVSNVPIPRPLNYDLMIKTAEKLSTGFPFLRVDFYEINNRMYLIKLLNPQWLLSD